jgi:hypothetical protein
MSAVNYRICSVYERLLEAIDDAAAKANAGAVRRRQSRVSNFKRQGSVVEFGCYVIFENWKWRASHTHERVTIVLHAQEELAANCTALNRSTVRVSYFDARDDGVRPLHTVHFDFGPQQICHPTFHAQLTADPIIPPDDEAEELKCEVHFTPTFDKGRCFQNARIPTCDMTLASVLLCLAADHLGVEFFREFKANVIEIQKSMPVPSYDEEMRKSLGGDLRRLSSSHWFAHLG